MAEENPQALNPPTGGAFTNLVTALSNIGRGLWAIQQVINNNFTNLGANNTFTGTNTFKKPTVENAGAVGTGTLLPMGLISKQQSAAGIGNGADATDDVLFTFSLPANSLDANGRTIIVESFGQFAANGNDKRVKIFFGASVVFSTGVVTTNNLGWYMRLTIQRTGSGAQIASGFGFVGAAIVSVPLAIVGSETDTGAIVIKTTGASPTSSIASDVLGMSQNVFYGN